MKKDTRFKVISTYPDMTRNLHDIINIDIENERYVNFFKRFPHIFKELKWYEEIDINDMPMFLKDYKIGKVVIKVYKWIDNFQFISDSNKDINFKSDIRIFIPATEEEYNNYILNKNSNK